MLFQADKIDGRLQSINKDQDGHVVAHACPQCVRRRRDEPNPVRPIQRDPREIGRFDAPRQHETERTLRDAAGLNGTRFTRGLSELLAEGKVEHCVITKQYNQKYPGYRLSGTDWDTP